MELLKKFNISIIFMKISIPLFFIMNSEINNKIDYSHTKKLQYIQVINKIPVQIVLRWKMVLSFAIYKYNMTCDLKSLCKTCLSFTIWFYSNIKNTKAKNLDIYGICFKFMPNQN